MGIRQRQEIRSRGSGAVPGHRFQWRGRAWIRATILGIQDWELHRRIPGIEAPWEVDRVELKLGKGASRLDLGVPGDQGLIPPRHE